MPESVVTGAAILQLALAYDILRIRGRSKEDAIADLKRHANFKPQLINILNELDTTSSAMEKKLVPIQELRSGMILEEEIRTSTGLLFVVKGQEITYPIIARLRNLRNKGAVPAQVLALVPIEKAKAAGAS